MNRRRFILGTLGAVGVALIGKEAQANTTTPNVKTNLIEISIYPFDNYQHVLYTYSVRVTKGSNYRETMYNALKDGVHQTAIADYKSVFTPGVMLFTSESMKTTNVVRFEDLIIALRVVGAGYSLSCGVEYVDRLMETWYPDSRLVEPS